LRHPLTTRFAWVTVDWAKPQHLTYFTYTQTLCLTFFGICAGAFMAWTRRFKWMITVGLCIRLIGCGLMLHARGPNGNMASFVMCQVLQGIGGGIAHTAMMVAAQASVSHIDVATVTAVVLLLTEIGNSVGSAAATGLWQQYMPGELATYVPTNNQTLLVELFGDITQIIALPADDPIKTGAITAYQHMMHRLVVGATVVAIFPIIVSIFMIKDIRLTDAQNAHDGKDLQGKPIEEADELYQIEKEEMAHRTRRLSTSTATA
jgi:MFS family permease